jgi:hypothetical protein
MGNINNNIINENKHIKSLEYIISQKNGSFKKICQNFWFVKFTDTFKLNTSDIKEFNKTIANEVYSGRIETTGVFFNTQKNIYTTSYNTISNFFIPTNENIKNLIDEINTILEINKIYIDVDKPFYIFKLDNNVSIDQFRNYISNNKVINVKICLLIQSK